MLLISEFFQLEIECYFGKCLCTHFDLVTKIQVNK